LQRPDQDIISILQKKKTNLGRDTNGRLK
jgi:hypothetical protein